MNEQLKLKAHTMICKACAHYEKQSELIEKGIEINQRNLKYDEDVRQLKEQINRELNKLRQSGES